MRKILDNVRKTTKANTPKVVEPQDNTERIKFDTALASNKFESMGRGLYLEASTIEKIGGIWAVREFENPDTHEKEKWLVSYQDDDDDIALKVANESLNKVTELFMSAPGEQPFGGDTGIDADTGHTGKTVVRLHVDDNPNSPTITDPFDITDMLSNGMFKNVRVEFEDGNTEMAGNLEGQTFDVVGGGIVTVASLNKTAADKIPDPKDIPLAQGIKSKNLTMDETGGGGTAKVTIEFTDPAKGLEFYQNQSGGNNKAEAPAPEEAQKEEAPKEEANKEQGPKAPAAPVPAVPPVPTPAGLGGLAPQSSVQKWTRGGKQNVMINIEKTATDYSATRFVGKPDYNFKRNRSDKGKTHPRGDVLPHELDMSRFDAKEWPREIGNDVSEFVENVPVDRKEIKKQPKVVPPITTVEDLEDDEDIFSFLNEEGEKIVLAWKKKLQVGDTFIRPDTGVEARVAGYKEMQYADNDDIIAVLAADEGVSLPFHRSRTDYNGNQHFYDEKGNYHNDEGPAFVGHDGGQEYYKHGKYHNDKGPAVVSPDGTVRYYIDGMPLTEEEFNRRKVREEQYAADMISNETEIPGITCDMINEGLKVEREHTSDESVARQIAIDHLAEDRDYYKKLKKVEAFHGAAPEEAPDVETPTKVDPDTETPSPNTTPSEPNRSPFRTPSINPAYIPSPKAQREIVNGKYQ